MTCGLCQRPKVVARGLCAACWAREKKRGNLALWEAKRGKRTHCKRGHEFTPENTVVANVKGRKGPRRSCKACRRPSKLLKDSFYRLTHRYAMTDAQYRTLLERQGGVCAICKRPQVDGGRALVIDHDHACCDGDRRLCGQCNRGLLCSLCNWALGNAQDSPARLRAMADYLEQWEANRCREPLIEVIQ